MPTEPKPSHRRFVLDPPHGERIFWRSVRSIPGDSRTEQISASRDWFWKGLEHAD